MTAKRRVDYSGVTYALRSNSIEVPDLDAMSRLAALVWLNQNTVAKGRSTRPVQPNLSGLRMEVK